ncbi:MAG TPA: 2'-5' RNA ligase family protein [Vicinamibacterales bacterium]|nr:2'-5' RNA ligase family protein [Vicinamibacterales bacterium]
MTDLALALVLLLPEDVEAKARAINAGLAAGDPATLRLDDEHLPHITLAQQVVRGPDLAAVFDAVARALRDTPPLELEAIGFREHGATLWLAIARSPALRDLHARLMDALAAFEPPPATAGAFAEPPRPEDLAWVSGFRTRAAYDRYEPHVTLGLGPRPSGDERFTFTAETAAACQLGRFCTCRRVLQRWRLAGALDTDPTEARTSPTPDVIVVVADRNERALLRAQLLEEGFEVVAVATPYDAELLLRNDRPPRRALVVEATGLDRVDRTLPVLLRLAGPERVLVLTSSLGPGAGELRTLGAAHVLSRPYRIGDVVDRIRQLPG